MLRVDFIPETKTKHMNTEEKVDFLLNEVKSQKIVIVENSLRPDEELLLIRKAMENVDFDDFTGVNYKQFKSEEQSSKSLFKSQKRKTFSVIAPPGTVEIHNENGILSLAIILKS